MEYPRLIEHLSVVNNSDGADGATVYPTVCFGTLPLQLELPSGGAVGI
jgi:hypothetical protein